MISKTIGYNGVHNIFRHTHIFNMFFCLTWHPQAFKELLPVETCRIWSEQDSSTRPLEWVVTCCDMLWQHPVQFLQSTRKIQEPLGTTVKICQLVLSSNKICISATGTWDDFEIWCQMLCVQPAWLGVCVYIDLLYESALLGGLRGIGLHHCGLFGARGFFLEHGTPLI